MNKDFAWELFKNTGNVDAFMIMKNMENKQGIITNDISNKVGELDGDSKD